MRRIVPVGSSEAHLDGRSGASRSRSAPVIVPVPFREVPAPWLDALPGGPRGPFACPPRRVFLSHASERAASRSERACVAAARSAVIRAGDAMIDMAFFTAQGTDPAQYCARMVTAADVYVGIIGFRYGTLVRGRRELSFTELEFEIATAYGLPRLVFLLAGDLAGPGRPRRSGPGARQAAFRRRLQRIDLTTAHVKSPGELETCLYQALVELHLGEQAAAVGFGTIASSHDRELASAPRPTWPRGAVQRACGHHSGGGHGLTPR